MANYVITHTNGKVYASLGEGVLDNRLGISLLGQNFHNYGQLIADNFLHLLENQANDAQPLNPIAGQLWWNTKTQVLSFFDGDRFKPCSSSAVGDTPPHKPLHGDQWWDTLSNQLKIYDGTDWVLVGPVYTKGQLFSGLLPVTVTDTASSGHLVLELQINGDTIATVSKDAAFTLSSPLNGITDVSPGITLAPNTILAGTALNAQHLGGIASTYFVTKNASSSILDGTLTVNGLGGITVSELSISTDSFSNYRIATTGHNITLASGAASLNVNAAGTVTTVEPTVSSSVATKQYVDNVVVSAGSSSNSYIDAKIAALVAGSPIPTLNGLSAAINHDPNYHTNISAALGYKANIDSPVFTGTPRATTPAASDSSTRIATTAFVKSVLAIDSPTFTGTVTFPVGTISVAPAKFQLSELTTVPVNHALEYDNTYLYLTNSSTQRKSLAFTDGTGATGTWGIRVTGAQTGITSVGTLTGLTVTNPIQGTIAGTSTNISTYPLNQSVATTSSPTFVNVYATDDFHAGYSDDRLKTKHNNIGNALSLVKSLNGFYYSNSETAYMLGFTDTKVRVGVSAQEVEAVMPEVVSIAPFDLTEELTSKSGENYKTVDYAKLVPLLIEAIKELNAEVEKLKGSK